MTSRILAIEPDRMQASQLSSIARRLGVELIVRESAEGAIEALANGLPDLILTPALLSRRDDLALTDRLRELGAAAAHIQTLTIPILDTSEPPSDGSVLSARRRDKARAAGPAACDTETFAEQVAIYLERTVEVRHARGEEAHNREPAAACEPEAPSAEDQPAMRVGDELPAAPAAREAKAATVAEQLAVYFESPDAGEAESSPETPAADAVVLCEVPALDVATEPNPDKQKDDWSFFDPEQARFVALLAKLDEIAAER